MFFIVARAPEFAAVQSDNGGIPPRGISQTKHGRQSRVGGRCRACLDSSVGAPPHRPSDLRVFLLLFLFLNFLYLTTSSGRVRTIDEVIVDWEAESLVLHGSTAVPQAVAMNSFYGKMDRDGKPQAPYGAAQAALVAPWYALGRLVQAMAPGVPAPARDIALDAVITSSSATFAALAAALLFLILARAGIPAAAAAGTSLIVALGTPLFAYSSWFFSEPLAAAILLAAAFAIFSGDCSAPVPVERAATGGLLLGVALWVRPTHVIAVPVFLLAILARERGRGIAPACAVAAVSGMFGAAYLFRNQVLFGNFFDFGYPATAEGGKHLNTFETPFITGLFGFLLSPGKSLFLFAPPLLVALPGVVRLARRDRGLAVLAGVAPIGYLLFYARYTQWEGGYSFGPRYLLPAIPLACLGLGAALADGSRGVRRLAFVLAVAGFLVQAVGMSTSFLEDQAKGGYYDAQWNYRMSYSPLVSQSRRLVHYLTSATPAPMGLGFDRWFVFLAKAGVARGTIAGVLLLECAGAFSTGWFLCAALRKSGAKDRAPGAMNGT